MGKKFRLSNMELDFISLVVAGDDPMAQVVIAKAAPEDDLSPEEWEEVEKRADHKSSVHRGLDRSPKENWVDKVGGLPSYIERIAKHLHSDRGMSISHAIAAAITVCRKWAAGGDGVKSDTQAKAAKALAEWEAKKKKARLSKEDMSGYLEIERSILSTNKSSREGILQPQKNDQIKKDDLPDEVVAYIEALEEALDARDAKVTKMEQDIEELKKAKPVEKADPNLDPFEAALAKADPGVAEILKAQKAQIEEAQAIAKAERDARLTATYIAKAETLPMISENKAELAQLLRSAADKLTTDEMAKIETILKAANAQIAKGNLFAEMGNSGAETTISKSVEAQAAELRKITPSLTIEQAISQVYESNPDLYAETLKEGA